MERVWIDSFDIKLKSAVRNLKSAILMSAILLALCVSASAQLPGKIPTIGFMRGGSPTDPEVEAFRQGLRELGYAEGKNIIIEYRNTEGKTDRFPGGYLGQPCDVAARSRGAVD
jgi:hypothetical protein